jgi:hypothetical protein
MPTWVVDAIRCAKTSDFHSFFPFDSWVAHRGRECLFDAAVNFAEFPKYQEEKNSHQVKQELNCHRLIPPAPRILETPGILLPVSVLLHALASVLKPSVHTARALNVGVMSRML